MEEKSSKNKKDTAKYVVSEAVSYIPFLRLYNVYARNKNLPKDEAPKSRWERTKRFLGDNPEVPLFVYDVVSTIGYAAGLSDPYYRELLTHGQTTDNSKVPFFYPQPSGEWGSGRRALNVLEYPGVVQGIANATYKAIKRGINHVRSKSKE